MAQYNSVDVRVDLYRSRLCDDGFTKLCESGILDPPLIILYIETMGCHWTQSVQIRHLGDALYIDKTK